MTNDTRVRDAESLLDQLTDTSIDSDYYSAHERPPGRLSKALSTLTICLFGGLLATAALQTHFDRPATELERSAMIDGVEARQETRDRRLRTVEALREELVELQELGISQDPAREALFVSAGEIAVSGEGVRVTARSGSSTTSGERAWRVTDSDLQLLINGLWQAGAEAIAVNGQRVIATTAIRTAGETITINYRSVGEPYVVDAIGDRDELVANLLANPAGRYWSERVENFGVEFNLESKSEVNLPAGPSSRLRTTYAQAWEAN